MKNLFLISFLTLITPIASYASCEALNKVKSLVLTNGQSFKYRFLKGSDSTQLTVVYLPGGPGQGAIDATDPRLSSSYGFIQTDPRGVGCNKNLHDSNLNLSSEDLASDIISLIKKESLENYIIYGISYGSALATIVANKIEQDPDTPNPKSLVLEGVLGRAFKPEEEDQAILIEWERYKQHTVLLNLFRSEEHLLGFSNLEIGAFLKGMLSYGRNPANPDYYLLENYFNLLRGDLSDRETLVRTIKDFNKPYPSELVRLYRQVGCEEFSSLGWKYDTYYVNGELVLGDSTKGICTGFPFVNGFDSAHYGITTKTYYFSGSNDPATPLWQAKHHLQNQDNSQKNIITVQGGGHHPLSYNLADCSLLIWEAILSGKNITQNSLDEACSLKTVVQ